jgi:hypothetical protein
MNDFTSKPSIKGQITRSSGKVLHSILSLLLKAIAVHRSGGKPLIEQVVVDKVNVSFAVHENQGSSGLQGHKEVV